MFDSISPELRNELARILLAVAAFAIVWLLRYLLAHKGERKDVTFVPKAGGPSVTATLIITPGAIGGSAGADLATATVTLPLIGEPLFVDAP